MVMRWSTTCVRVLAASNCALGLMFLVLRHMLRVAYPEVASAQQCRGLVAPAEHARLEDAPLVLMGAFHKSGTVLSRKMMAVTCLSLRLCCVFHGPGDRRDSLEASSNRPEVSFVSVLLLK